MRAIQITELGGCSREVDAREPAEARRAHQDLRSRRTTGKLVPVP